MVRGKVIRRKTSGCCWRKLLGKALKKGEQHGLEGTSSDHHHPCFDQDEIVYLNLYLTSLEKKLQAIEEITRLKWYRQRMRSSKGDVEHYINGLRYCTEEACKKFLSADDGYCSEFSNQLLPSTDKIHPTNRLVGSNSDVIIREILSLGANNFHHELKNRKWAALISPERSTFSENKVVELFNEAEAAAEPKCSSTNPPERHCLVVSKYQVAALCYSAEIHVATQLEGVNIQSSSASIRASCTVELFDNEAKTIEISYDNRYWDKKGTIVLRDIENQIGVQTELIGRVVCFLLGMGDTEMV